MKKSMFFYAAAATALFTACSSDEGVIGQNESDVVNVAFTANLDQVMKTRAVSGDTDGKQASTLTVAVYNKDKQEIEAIRQVKADAFDASLNATVNFQLVKGQTYSFAFWAQNPSATADAVVFDPATGKVSVDYSKIKANDESLDAFTAHVNELKVTGALSQSVTLKRPWAQVNYGATPADIKGANLTGIKVNKTEVTIDNVYQTLNLLDGTVADPTTATITLAAEAIPTGQTQFDITVDDAATTATYGKLHVDNDNAITTDDDYAYLGLNYLLVGGEADTQSLIKADLTIYKDNNGTDEKVNEIAFSNVPVQRNYRTNIVGNLLTSQVDFNIHIDADYEDDINVNTNTETDAEGNQFTYGYDASNNLASLDAVVKSDNGLSKALTTNAKNITITLAEDNLKYIYAGNQQVGGATTEDITINGNDNTLVFGGKGNDSNMLNGNITIKNATVNYDNIGGTETWNARSISFGGNLIAENVEFNNEVAAKGLKAEFKNCIFNEATDNYALWLSATLEDVVIDECTFIAENGRGIKIADQYVDAAKLVNLTISNSTFTTAKKAAVLVTNTAGAKITAQGTNNISGVTEDNVNLVWNDPDRATAYDLVVVNGCTKIQK